MERPLTSHFRQARIRSHDPSTSTAGQDPNARSRPAYDWTRNPRAQPVGMPAKQDADKAKARAKAESRKTLPNVEDWTCTFKHRKLPSTQASLNKLFREVSQYVKIDAIRETAYLDEAERTNARDARQAVLRYADRERAPVGKRDDGSVADADLYEHFNEANETAVRVLLSAVKDPSLNNELHAIHEQNEGGRTAMRIVETLRKKFDSNDFVYRFLHLLDFIEFEQSKAMSAIDFTEDYQRRMTRLRATYTHTHTQAVLIRENFEPSDPQPSSSGLYLLNPQESPQAPSPREGFWQATGR